MPKTLTKNERRQIVELLRCAAELNMLDSSWGGLYAAGVHLGLAHSKLWNYAFEARIDARNKIPYVHDYMEACLEAAAMVEEGSWPVTKKRSHRMS